jgi:tetratricopeptide (TPR) repeat protein
MNQKILLFLYSFTGRLLVALLILTAFSIVKAQDGDGRVEIRDGGSSKVKTNVNKNITKYKKKFLPKRTEFRNSPQTRKKFNPKVKNGDYYEYQAQEFLSLGKFESAIENYGKFLKLNPRSKSGLRGRARAFLLAERYDEAVRDINTVIKLYPGEAPLVVSRAVVYMAKEDWAMALEDLNKALKISPNLYYVFRYRGIIYREKGETDKALKEFEKAFALAKGKANDSDESGNTWEINKILYERSVLYFEQKSYKQALADLTAVINSPDYNEPPVGEERDYDAYELRADVYQALGESEKAQADIKMVEEIKAENEAYQKELKELLESEEDQ